jgi:hypothetical protein
MPLGLNKVSRCVSKADWVKHSRFKSNVPMKIIMDINLQNRIVIFWKRINDSEFRFSTYKLSKNRMLVKWKLCSEKED